MKKLFTLFAAASMVLAAQAGTRVLYAQDFEGVTSAAEAGWSYGGASMEILSDDFGSFLQLNQGATNGRNAQVTWGDAIYGENGSTLEDGVYTLTFDYCPKQSSNNQYNSGITVTTNLLPPANQPFLGRWNYLKDAEGNNIEDMSLYQGYLFDLLQVQRETENTTSIQYKVNGDANDLITLNADWYTITLVVDVNNRTVAYDISDLMGTTITAGDRKVPETECDGTEISMYATGLWVMVARYQTQFCFDNFKVSCESSIDVANTPSCALTRLGKDAEGELNLDIRAYTINFIEGEVLHVLGTDGVEDTVQYFDCDGAYVYETTTSGVLSVWTTCGNATSEVVETEVDCTPCALPEAVASILSVENGYAKTYKLTVDNTTVPLSPQIFITYIFVGENGAVVEAEEQGSGVTFTVPEAGTLTVTTAAFGYQSTTTTIENDIPYAEKYVVDFARMGVEDIKAAGFTADEDLNSASTSGEQNWTARKRLFYYDAATATVDEESGETVYTPVYPFGYVADDSENVLHRWIISADDMTKDKAAKTFEHVVLWNGLQAKMLQGIGLIQDATTNNYNAVQFTGLVDGDIIVVNTIGSYGSDSCHPVCNTADEYFAQLKGTDTAFAVAALGTEDLGKKAAGAWKIEQKAEEAEDAENAEGAKVAEDAKPAEPAIPVYNVAFNLYRIDTALTKATVFAADGESGIINIANDLKNADNAWYTIDGIRLQAPVQSGLYIHNGKKVYIRK